MFEMASPPQSADEHFDAAAIPRTEVVSQINPELELHVLVPHIQSSLFGVVPSLMVHDDTVLQVLMDSSQWKPESVEHLVDPH